MTQLGTQYRLVHKKWPWTQPGTAANACVYEWRKLPMQQAAILPTDPRFNTSYRSFFNQLLFFNSSKNQKREQADACVQGAAQRQLWSLQVRTPDRTVQVPSIADGTVTERYLQCMRGRTVAFVGDSFPLQTWVAMARALLRMPAKQAS